MAETQAVKEYELPEYSRTAVPASDARVAQAAEYQALYLSRIATQLERIADALGKGYPKINVLSELQQIRVGLAK